MRIRLISIREMLIFLSIFNLHHTPLLFGSHRFLGRFHGSSRCQKKKCSFFFLNSSLDSILFLLPLFTCNNFYCNFINIFVIVVPNVICKNKDKFKLWSKIESLMWILFFVSRVFNFSAEYKRVWFDLYYCFWSSFIKLVMIS